MSLIKPYRFMSEAEIEAQANNLLRRMQQTPKYAPKLPFDATRVADFLDLGVYWESLPADEQGAIAALILPIERQIVLNELGVAISNLTTRLQKLNWITIPPGSRQVYRGKVAK